MIRTLRTLVPRDEPQRADRVAVPVVRWVGWQLQPVAGHPHERHAERQVQRHRRDAQQNLGPARISRRQQPQVSQLADGISENHYQAGCFQTPFIFIIWWLLFSSPCEWKKSFIMDVTNDNPILIDVMNTFDHFLSRGPLIEAISTCFEDLMDLEDHSWEAFGSPLPFLLRRFTMMKHWPSVDRWQTLSPRVGKINQQFRFKFEFSESKDPNTGSHVAIDNIKLVSCLPGESLAFLFSLASWLSQFSSSSGLASLSWSWLQVATELCLLYSL